MSKNPKKNKRGNCTSASFFIRRHSFALSFFSITIAIAMKNKVMRSSRYFIFLSKSSTILFCSVHESELSSQSQFIPFCNRGRITICPASRSFLLLWHCSLLCLSLRIASKTLLRLPARLTCTLLLMRPQICLRFAAQCRVLFS